MRTPDSPTSNANSSPGTISPLRLLGSAGRSSRAIKAGRPRSDDEPNEVFYAMFNSEEGTKATAVLECCKQYMNTGSEVSACHVVFRVHFFCRIAAAPSTGNTRCWRITPLQSLTDYADTKDLQQVTSHISFNSKKKRV